MSSSSSSRVTPDVAARLADKLDALNNDRRATEAQALDAIETRLSAIKEQTGEYPAECLILDDPAWHRGVLGILASRVVDRTGRPTLVMTHKDGQAHGSGRSITGFHLLDALTAVDSLTAVDNLTAVQDSSEGQATLFTRFGGHAHAVGFSLPSDQVQRLRQRMGSYAGALLNAPLLQPRLACDLELSLSEVTDEFYDWLDRFAPFGNSNPEPISLSRYAVLSSAPRIIKDRHICLQLERPGGNPLEALGWSRSFDWTVRCAELSLAAGSKIDLAYRIKRNTHTRSIELELCDIQCSDAPSG